MSVTLQGSAQDLIESCTFFVWLSTAVRAAPSGELAYCVPELRYGDSTTTCVITHIFTIPKLKLQATCWHKMFHNPVIAMGYPITPRGAEEQGLEMPFSMMAVLAQTPFAASFQGATVLKGFSTILSLVKRTGNLFSWHFLIDKERKRMPYNEGLRITRLQMQVGEQDLQMGRHIVGWTPSIDVFAGRLPLYNGELGFVLQFS